MIASVVCKRGHPHPHSTAVLRLYLVRGARGALLQETGVPSDRALVPNSGSKSQSAVELLAQKKMFNTRKEVNNA